MSSENTNATTKSEFVSIFAWISIVIFGFTTLISILQNIMFHMVFPKEEMLQAMQRGEQAENVPIFAQYIFNYFDLFLLLFLILTLTGLISAIGLLKRKNWARIAFVILLSLGIIYNIIGLIVQFTFFDSIPKMSGENTAPEFENIILIIKVASVVMAVGFSTVFGFIIKKLCSKNIKAEFA